MQCPAAPFMTAPAPPVARPRSSARAALVERSATFTIGELALEFDLTTRAIRFYEDSGLLAPQRHGSRRVYSQRDRTRLKLTLRGKRLGLTLAEIRELVDMYDSPRDTQAQLAKFLLVLALHRAALEQQMTDLDLALNEVRTQQKEVRRLLARAAKKELPP